MARYKWDSPHDWLGDKINARLATALAALPTQSNGYCAAAELATIANTIVNGSLPVDSDMIQDAFQDEMAEAGYFRDLDQQVPVLYEMEPIGVDDAPEATIVHWFCSEQCRKVFEIDIPVEAGENGDFADGTQCEECGNVVHE